MFVHTLREYWFIKIIQPLFTQGGPTDVFTLFCIGALWQVLQKKLTLGFIKTLLHQVNPIEINNKN